MSEERVNEAAPATEDGEIQEMDASASDPDRPAEDQDETGSEAASSGEVESDSASDEPDLEAEYAELNDRHLRLAAEFNNFRRRVESEALGTWSRAQANLIERFLEVLDDLQRVSALDPADEKVTVQSIVEGIDLVERKFARVLDDAGTVSIDPAPGDAFDPETMEAMMRVPTDDEAQDDAVAQVFQKGYAVDGTLVRAARVSVYKAD